MFSQIPDFFRYFRTFPEKLTKYRVLQTFSGWWQPCNSSTEMKCVKRKFDQNGVGWSHKHLQRLTKQQLGSIYLSLQLLALPKLEIYMPSQQPGNLEIHPFWTDRSINLFFLNIWSSNLVHKRLKNNLPPTFKRTIGCNTSIDSWLLNFIFGT